MNFIKFIDTCDITRMTGEKDEWDNPTYDLVYSGECLYQEGGSSESFQVSVKQPTVYIPMTEELLYPGDVVEVITKRGRAVKGVVRVVRDISLRVFGNTEITRLEIYQGQETEE